MVRDATAASADRPEDLAQDRSRRRGDHRRCMAHSKRGFEECSASAPESRRESRGEDSAGDAARQRCRDGARGERGQRQHRHTAVGGHDTGSHGAGRRPADSSAEDRNPGPPTRGRRCRAQHQDDGEADDFRRFHREQSKGCREAAGIALGPVRVTTLGDRAIGREQAISNHCVDRTELASRTRRIARGLAADSREGHQRLGRTPKLVRGRRVAVEVSSSA